MLLSVRSWAAEVGVYCFLLPQAQDIGLGLSSLVFHLSRDLGLQLQSGLE